MPAPGLQPTYEELKPLRQGRFSEFGTGLQPTYEELKQIFPDFTGAGFKGLQPTYEELKPPGVTGIAELVVRLQPTYEELKRWEVHQMAVDVLTSPAYLWGIETKYLPSPSAPSSGLQPTYEELKLVKLYTDAGEAQGLQPTYEELKLLRRYQNELRDTSPAYLWGIETGIRQPGPIRTLPRLQPTYEELKRLGDGLTKQLRLRLQPTYEELKLITQVGGLP